MSGVNKIKSIYQTQVRKFGAHLTWGVVAGTLLLIIFAKLAGEYRELGAFDATVGSFIRSYATEGLTKLVILITQLGSGYVEIGLLLAAGGYLLFRLKHVWETVVLFIGLSGGWLLNTVLRAVFHRTRPEIQHLVEAGGYSFPSGHAMVSVAFYGMLGYLLWLNLRERSIPAWYVPVLTVCLIVSIGISRIYLGVHFPSDVIAGFAAGGAWLAACIVALHAIRYFKSE